MTTAPVRETETGHVTELLYDDGGDGVLACAAHGGRIEPATGEQALELARRLDGACWTCLGYDDDGEEFDQFHVTSTAIDPAEYELLGRIADRGFSTVVSFHGLSDPGVLVGGGIDAAVKARVARRLDRRLSADVETVSEGPYAGTSPENFVNWLAAGQGGLQVEQGPPTRSEEADEVVATLAEAIDAGELRG